MNKIFFSKEQIEEIIHMYTVELKSQPQIGKKFNVNRKVIRRVLVENGIEIRNPYIENLIGKRFGRLEVIDTATGPRHKQRYWKCKCDCGNIMVATTTDLKSGNTTSCGCKRKETLKKLFIKDWTGYVAENGVEFISRSEQQSSGTHYLWNCKCPICGKIFLALPQNIIKGGTSSCGCKRIYKGEEKIKKILIKNNYIFSQQYRITNAENRYQFVDFAVFDKKDNDKIAFFIEFDGIQHYESVEYFGGEKAYRQTRERDFFKNLYCLENNIPLFRIPYTDLNKINDIKDILKAKYLMQNKEGENMIRFKQKDENKFYKEPTRSTQKAAGYDIYCSEDVTIPSYFKQVFKVLDKISDFKELGGPKSIKEVEEFNVKNGLASTLVSTNVTYELDDNFFIGIYSRSSISSKNLLVLANSVGVADADYTGEIKISILNLSPNDITIKQGDKIAQLIVHTYAKTDEDSDDNDKPKRKENEEGGFGSTNDN